MTLRTRLNCYFYAVVSFSLLWLSVLAFRGLLAPRVLAPGYCSVRWTSRFPILQGRWLGGGSQQCLCVRVSGTSALVLITVTCTGPSLSLPLHVCLTEDFTGLRWYFQWECHSLWGSEAQVQQQQAGGTVLLWDAARSASLARLLVLCQRTLDQVDCPATTGACPLS